MIPYNKIRLYDNVCSISDEGSWFVTSLIDRIKDKDAIHSYKLDLYSIDLSVHAWGDSLSMYELINHFRQCTDADLKYPIIVSEEGWILDGWHRVVKAILEGKRYVKAVRFKVNPTFDTISAE